MAVTPESTVSGLLAFRKWRSLGCQSQTLLQYGIGHCSRLWWQHPWRQIPHLSRQYCRTHSKSPCFSTPPRATRLHLYLPLGSVGQLPSSSGLNQQLSPTVFSLCLSAACCCFLWLMSWLPRLGRSTFFPLLFLAVPHVLHQHSECTFLWDDHWCCGHIYMVLNIKPFQLLPVNLPANEEMYM